MVLLRFKTITAFVLLSLSFASAAYAQEPAEKKAEPAEKKEEKKPETPAVSKDPNRPVTAEQVAESTIVIFGFPGGRALLNQIRKTAIERGRISVTNGEGKTEQATYQRWTIRADNLSKERIRLDQDFSNARYALVFNDEKIFGIFNDSVFTPREDASRAFENQIVRGLEALLRYKENESKIELAGKEKIMGVELYQVDVTDKQSRKTRFYISAKSFRVMMLDYEEEGVKYRRKFYNYNYAQGTLVPYRSVLWANDKIVEETEVATVTFGQKVDEDLFKAG